MPIWLVSLTISWDLQTDMLYICVITPYDHLLYSIVLLKLLLPFSITYFIDFVTAEFLGKEQRDPIKDANGNTIGLKLSITGARYENSGHYECKGC